MLVGPAPVWLMLPWRLLKDAALMVIWLAAVLALSRLKLPLFMTSTPLLMSWPRWPLNALTPMLNAPVPACSSLPSVFVRVCAASVRFCALVAMRPLVLFKLPARLMLALPVPV